MATLFTHAALPVIGLRAAEVPPQLVSRLRLLAIAVACAPDLDWVGALLDADPSGPLGHRGLTHSVTIAVALALLGALAFPRAHRRLAVRWLLIAAASHGLLDLLTYGEA